jgi:hypothetical protein
MSKQEPKTLQHVYGLTHHHMVRFENPLTGTLNFDDIKLIGLFKSRREAKEAIVKLSKQPGFDTTPNGFKIERFELDTVKWSDGFGVHPNCFRPA